MQTVLGMLILGLLLTSPVMAQTQSSAGGAGSKNVTGSPQNKGQGSAPTAGKQAGQHSDQDVVRVSPQDLRSASQFMCTNATIQQLQTNEQARKGLWKYANGQRKMKHYVTALKVYQCLQRAVPYFAKLHVAMAMVLEKLGQYPDAAEHYKSFLAMASLDKGSPVLQSIKQKIASIQFLKPKRLPPGVLSDLHEKSIITQQERVNFQKEQLREAKAKELAAAQTEAQRKAIEAKFRKMEKQLDEFQKQLEEERRRAAEARRKAAEAEKEAAEAQRKAAEAQRKALEAKMKAEEERRKAAEERRKLAEARSKGFTVKAYRYKTVPTRTRKIGSWIARFGGLGVFIALGTGAYSYYLWQQVASYNDTVDTSVPTSVSASLQNENYVSYIMWDDNSSWSDYRLWMGITQITAVTSLLMVATGTTMYFVGGSRKVKVRYDTEVQDAGNIRFTPMLTRGGMGLALETTW